VLRRFGDEKQTYEQYSTTWSIKPYDPSAPGTKAASTYVSFVFRYRSRGKHVRKFVPCGFRPSHFSEFLESQGIIPESERRSPISILKRPPGRRVVSLPLANMPSLEVSGLSPPKKKPKFSSPPVNLHSFVCLLPIDMSLGALSVATSIDRYAEDGEL